MFSKTPHCCNKVEKQTEEELVTACKKLLAYVRKKYEIPDDESFSCEHMNRIDTLVTEAEKK